MARPRGHYYDSCYSSGSPFDWNSARRVDRDFAGALIESPPKAGGDAIAPAEIAREMGLLLIAEFEADGFHAIGGRQHLARLFESNLPEPFRNSEIVLLAKMALQRPHGDLAKTGEDFQAEL